MQSRLKKDSRGNVFFGHLAKPEPSGGSATRNASGRAWLHAGDAWAVVLVTPAGQQVLSSGKATPDEGKDYCVHVKTRVFADSEAPGLADPAYMIGGEERP